MPYAIMPEPKVKYFRLIFHPKIDSKTNTWYDTLVSLVSFLYHTLIFIVCFGGTNSLPANVLWDSFVTHPWGRNECVTNEPQRTSAGRLGH